MADPLPWPSVLMPSSEDWSLRGGTRSGGQTFQGNEQVIASPTARWKATLEIPCWEPEHIFAMRRVIALGRAQTWLLGPYERDRAPWRVDNVLAGIVTDRTPGAPQPALSFSLGEDAPVGSPAIVFSRASGGLLAAGMTFSIGNRLHIITDLTTADPRNGGVAEPGLVGGQIRPWLRDSYGAGTAIEFGAPVGTMRLASDDTGAMELQLSRYGTVTLDLVEAH